VESCDLLLLTGPTASGKSALAVDWATRLGAEVLSCDSLLFYRGLDIGSAKPTPGERRGVPHHFIDVRAVDEPWNVADYARAALDCASAIRARGRLPIAVGGSGFYLACYLRAVDDGRTVPDAVREHVRGLERDGGLPALVRDLARHNPDGLPADLDVRNPRRVARALEACLASGLPIARLREQFRTTPSLFAGWNIRVIRLQRSRTSLHERITARTDAMLRGGLVDEVRRARANGLERNPPAAASVGYRECLNVLDGKLPHAQLAEAIDSRTRALVRKQETWFRHQLPEHAVIDLDAEPCPARPPPGPVFRVASPTPLPIPPAP
jgi:tRNA dimethylallyltransferase